MHLTEVPRNGSLKEVSDTPEAPSLNDLALNSLVNGEGEFDVEGMAVDLDALVFNKKKRGE